METDYLIVGQGISGTLLSWFLHKEGKSFLVIDDGNEQSASKAAAGIINPVTGRRYACSWMADELMRFAFQTYAELGNYLSYTFIHNRSIIDFFPTAQMRNAFTDRLIVNSTYLHSYPDQNYFNEKFHYEFGCGEINPCYVVLVQPLLQLWRKKLTEWKALTETTFDTRTVRITKENIIWENVIARRIIFCDGIRNTRLPWFNLLPFSANKGEALLIECKEIESTHIYKKGLMLAFLSEPGLFWLGSSYEWAFDNELPSDKFHKHAAGILSNWLKVPYKILDHKSAVRPATLERRPFVGWHPVYPNLGILNGMGTKGTSLAPFFAHQLANNMVHGFPISPEADIKRFNKTLSR